MLRLHIDIPLGTDLESATLDANLLLACLKPVADRYKIQYRLSADGDRGNKNHMNIVDGRPGGSKCQL